MTDSIAKYINIARGLAKKYVEDEEEAFSYLLETLARCLNCLNIDSKKDATGLVINWLTRGLRWFSSREYARRNRFDIVEEEDEDIPDDISLMEDAIRRIRLSEMVSRLSISQRRLLDAYLFCVKRGNRYNLYQAIGERLGIPVGTVKSKIWHIRKKMEKYYAESEV